MNRKQTIKIMRKIIRILQDETIFVDSDFVRESVEGCPFPSRVDNFIASNLGI